VQVFGGSGAETGMTAGTSEIVADEQLAGIGRVIALEEGLSAFLCRSRTLRLVRNRAACLGRRARALSVDDGQP
jgi:hypothetical protein